MSNLETKRLRDMPVKVIGPQLGLPNHDNSIIITIALPHIATLDRLICVLLSAEGQEIENKSSDCADNIFRSFIFRFDNLRPGQKYFYKFKAPDENEIPLEGDLSYENCWFFCPSFNNETDKFVLLSCNNPFESGHDDKSEQFRMWKYLNDHVKENMDIRFIIQGGDQIYNDRIEYLINDLKGEEASSESVQTLTDEIIKNYQDYYSNLDYRQLMARIPSVAMLDDHDITDGWGGRPESFAEGNTYKKEWFRFFELTYRAFKAYQSIKNPEPITKTAATTYLDLGNNRFYLLDLRAEKNVKSDRPLVSEQHEHDLFESLNNIPNDIDNVFVLCPVVPCRINPDTEKLFAGLSQLLIATRTALHNADDFNGKALILSLIKKIPLVNLYDDLTDSLSSEENIHFLRKLLNSGYEIMHQGKKFILLSGDIHTGGLSELYLEKNNTGYCVPQIVSSPIGYEPMKKAVKDSTTEEMELDYSEGNDFKITGRNIFYRSDRNFAVITPSRLTSANGIEFYFEHLAKPIVCPAYFYSTAN